jgi:CelD/BcsL family acetyltransferase involved in cellulose biosynthesis
LSLHSALDLDAEMDSLWDLFCEDSLRPPSPYLSPVFARLVGEVVGQRAVVAVFSDDTGAPIGYLPLQVTRKKLARTIAPGFASCDGVVHRSEFNWAEARRLLSRRFSFLYAQRLLPEQVQMLGMTPGHQRSLAAADLSSGWDAYLEWLTTTHPKWLKNARSGRRKLEAAYGTVELRFDDPDPQAWSWLTATKRAQCLARGWRDVYSDPFTRELTEASLGMREQQQARGVISTLRCEEKIIAAEYGFVSPDVHAGSVLVHDASFDRFSVGWILLLELCMASARAGRTRHELGEGSEAFKQKLANETLPLLGASLAGTDAIGQTARALTWGQSHLKRQIDRHDAIEQRTRHAIRAIRRVSRATSARSRMLSRPLAS